jgi:hypothetical protein
MKYRVKRLWKMFVNSFIWHALKYEDLRNLTIIYWNTIMMACSVIILTNA